MLLVTKTVIISEFNEFNEHLLGAKRNGKCRKYKDEHDIVLAPNGREALSFLYLWKRDGKMRNFQGGSARIVYPQAVLET